MEEDKLSQAQMHPVAEVQALINTLKRVNMSESMDVDSFHFEKKLEILA